MIGTTPDTDAAGTFEAHTIGLSAISARLEALENEHGKLARLFSTTQADIGAALDRGDAPYGLIQKLSEIDRELQDLEKKIAAELSTAIEALVGSSL